MNSFSSNNINNPNNINNLNNLNNQNGGWLSFNGIPLLPGLKALLPPVWFGTPKRQLYYGKPPYIHMKTILPLNKYNELKFKEFKDTECSGCDNHWCFCKSSTGNYYVKNHDKIYSGAGVLLIDNNSRYILFKNTKNDLLSDCGGSIEKQDYKSGEADKVLKKTAIRELEEESIKTLNISYKYLNNFVDIQDDKGKYYRCYIIKFNENSFNKIKTAYDNNLKNKDMLEEKYKETNEIKSYGEYDAGELHKKTKSDRFLKIMQEYEKNKENVSNVELPKDFSLEGKFKIYKIE